MPSEMIENWLCEAVEFYRPKGFFRQVKGDDEALVLKLLPHFEAQEASGDLSEEEMDTPEFDLFFLSFDPMRTLYESMDFGAGLGVGLDAYVETLKTLARISRGTFNPIDITETWDSPKGPIHIRFTLGDEKKSFKVDHWDGMFDFRLLLQLNLTIWDTPYRFEMAPLEDILFVTVLTAEEKTDLERLRGLAFMVLDLPRNFLPLAGLSPPLELPDDPEQPVFYCGTLNENLDRCVGRLRFIVRGNDVEGHHRFEGDAHQEDFAFTGHLSKSSGRLKGQLRGQITVAGEPRDYEGEWTGQMAKGNRVASGTWQGWFVDEKAPGGDRPADGKRVYKGQLGLLEEDSLRMGHPHIARTREWLEMVWASRNSEDYPWLLPI